MKSALMREGKSTREMTRLRRALLGSAVVAGLLAAPAQADHHFMSIREFFPGTSGNPNTRGDAFVELQMYAAGQQFVGGHYIDVYGAGMGTATPFLLGATPALLGDNQRTVLIGGPDVAGRDRDAAIGASIDPLGGAVCFRSTAGFGLIDCVEWGTGNTNVAAGTPVAGSGIPDMSSITRSIAPGCPTLLEPADDTNDSSTDFAVTSSTPRANAVVPSETPCITTPPVTTGPPAVPSAGTPGVKRRVRRCKKKPSKNSASAAKKKPCKKKRKK